MKIQHNRNYPEHREPTWAIQSYPEWRKQTLENPYGRLRDIREMLVQLIFQSVRGADLTREWKRWIQCASTMSSLKTIIGYGYASCAMIRDITMGRGERLLAYKQLWAFYEAIAEQNITQAEQLVRFMIIRWTDDTDAPYGTWQDARDMATYIYHQTRNRRHPLIVDLLNHMIGTTSTNVVKWFPREHTSPIYDTFVEEWYKHHGYVMDMNTRSCDLRTMKRPIQTHCRRRVRKDIQQIYRTISRPNIRKELPLTWSKKEQEDLIRPHILNIHQRHVYPGHLVQRVRQWIELKQSPMRWHSFPLSYLSRVVDKLWVDMEDALSLELSQEVPYVDVSAHMTDEQLNHALGLALLCGRHCGQVILVGDVPLVVRIQGKSVYTQIVDLLMSLTKVRGAHFNIYHAIRTFHTMHPQRIIIFSTFQAPLDEDSVKTPKTSVLENLQSITTKDQQFMFWNVSHTNSFPTQATDTRCYMLAGYSPYEFKIPSMVMGIELTKVHMPYSHLLMRLNSYRYELFVKFFEMC